MRPREHDFGGLDGETNYLSRTEEGVIKTGKTWSPHDSSLIHKLIIVCKQIFSIGVSNQKKHFFDPSGEASEGEISSSIDKLLLDLEGKK